MSIQQSRPPRSIQNVFVLLLVALFAAFSTLLVTLGAQVYRGTVNRANANNQARILSMVVRSALWAEDGVSEFLIEEQDGLPVLAIVTDFDGERYVKRLYSHEGMLRESFTAEDYPFSVEDGESICPAQSFVPMIEKGLLTVLVTDGDGQQSTVKLQLRTAGE